MTVMLILRGIAGHYDGRDWPRGALDEAPALAYARRRGYVGEVLDVAGTTGDRAPQTRQALARIMDRSQSPVTALYGFSGGGYNLRHILDDLNATQRATIKLVVVLGAPNMPPRRYAGPWELVYRTDPPAGHMAGPARLLAELGPESPPIPTSVGPFPPVAPPGTGLWSRIGAVLTAVWPRRPQG